ncbi:MAG: uroporphyrinogen-III C-methyltransferase [Candidatus Nezhaarchaeales archaeon]
MSRKSIGKVYIVGAGPGDPELITIKGLKALKKGDVIIYDRLVNPKLLKYAVKAKELINVGKEKGEARRQDEINELMIEKARQGFTVVRLKGGDPMLYGRVGEECEALRKAGIPYEIIPGVSAFQAAAAYSEIYITHRHYSSSLAIATGHEEGGTSGKKVNLTLLAKAADTMIIFMGVSKLKDIVDELLRGDLDPNTSIAIVQNASLRNQVIVRGKLRDIVHKVDNIRLSPPAMIFIGKAVEHMPQRPWFKCRKVE